MVADEHFVLSWPVNLPLDSGAPLLCAGITTYSPLRHFGLDHEQMQAASSSLDGIIDTVSATHPIAPLLSVLKPEKPLELAAFSLIMGRKIIAGSAIGWLKETQEMLEFAAEHGVTADIELIPIDYVNTAMERLLKSDIRYRFVIDVAKLLKAP